MQLCGPHLNDCNFSFYLSEYYDMNLIQTSLADARKALPIKMSDSKIDLLSLIEKLENVLAILDNNGQPIAAIKVEEAINSLKQKEEDR